MSSSAKTLPAQHAPHAQHANTATAPAEPMTHDGDHAPMLPETFVHAPPQLPFTTHHRTANSPKRRLHLGNDDDASAMPKRCRMSIDDVCCQMGGRAMTK